MTTLTALVANGAKVVIHCSAGIHRTGMFTYALLRACGLDSRDALLKMEQARAVTAEGVGDQRLTWAEDLSTLVRHRLTGNHTARNVRYVTSGHRQRIGSAAAAMSQYARSAHGGAHFDDAPGVTAFEPL